MLARYIQYVYAGVHKICIFIFTKPISRENSLATYKTNYTKYYSVPQVCLQNVMSATHIDLVTMSCLAWMFPHDEYTQQNMYVCTVRKILLHTQDFYCPLTALSIALV